MNDGTNAYTYNAANRLVSVVSAEGPTFYQYNGLGDRVKQNGTVYTLDINTGLTQVLSDGTNTYTYGLSRISQRATDTEYFLGDALGSVRQLTNASGEVTYAKSYTPYGESMISAGSGESIYAFTGEQQDASGLTYLRARYYNAADGRFMSRDTWEGNSKAPMSYTMWLYAYANSVNYIDPSGRDPWGCDALDTPEKIKKCYDDWSSKDGVSHLKHLYEENPNQALMWLKQVFSIKLPPGFWFRFAYAGHGFLAADMLVIEGYNPPFFDKMIFEEGKELHNWILEYGKCVEIDSNDPGSIAYFDSGVYITQYAFLNYDFYPDDVASIMLHEAVHAWQEFLYPQQVGTFKSYNVDTQILEIQAYKMELELNTSGRTQLKGRKAVVESRIVGMWPESPITLPAGVP